MNLSFLRIFFLLLCTTLTTIVSGTAFGSFEPLHLITGSLFGLILGFTILSLEILFKKAHLKSFNVAILGLFLGYMMSEVIFLTFQSATLYLPLPKEIFAFSRLFVLLSSLYLGLVLTAKASKEVALHLPFIQLQTNHSKNQQFIIDSSTLADPRIVDVASTGVFNSLLIIPKFLLKDLQAQTGNFDDTVKNKAVKSLEAIKKLEEISNLNLRYEDTDFADAKDSFDKVVQLANYTKNNILTADINKIKHSKIDDSLLILSLHSLSNALKPTTQTGENLSIKIQRYGKEPRQGIGYLEDGTMVVINGGGDFIGETIKAHVLSVKHRASGRMIFTNISPDHHALENTPTTPDYSSPSQEENFSKSQNPKDYFLV